MLFSFGNLDRVGNRFALRYPRLFFVLTFFLVPIALLAILALGVLSVSLPLCLLLDELAVS